MLAWCRWFLSEYERVLEGYWGPLRIDGKEFPEMTSEG